MASMNSPRVRETRPHITSDMRHVEKEASSLRKKLAYQEKRLKKSKEKVREEQHRQSFSDAGPQGHSPLQQRSINSTPKRKKDALKSTLTPRREGTPVGEKLRKAAKVSTPSATGKSTAVTPKRQASRTVQMKVLIVGDTKCGKTSLIQRYAHGKFEEAYKTTVGADFSKKLVTYDEETDIRLQLWDIAGQDRFAELTRAYFRNAVGAIVVCDVTRPLTTKSVINWKKVLDEKVRLPTGEPIPIILIANKTDLLTTGTESFETGARIEKVCSENGFRDWFIASAKEGSNVTEAVDSLIGQMMTNFKIQLDKEKKAGRAATVTRNKVSLDGDGEGQGGCRVGPRTGKCCS